MKAKLFVVTDVEAGWDCIRGIYRAKSEKDVIAHIADEQGDSIKDIEDKYIVHEEYEIIDLTK